MTQRVSPINSIRSEMRRLLACAVHMSLVAAPAAAASKSWTFCVASARGGGDVWVTDVFATTHDRVRLERA